MNTQPTSDHVHRPSHGIPEIVLEIEGMTAARGVEAYLVGGAVRDSLLGRTPKEYDIAVATDASAFAKLLADQAGGHFVSLDTERDTARVVIPSETDPVAIDFTHISDDIHSDLGRRDFTINAMAARLDGVAGGEWDVIDPCGGRHDLGRGEVRAVKDDVFRLDAVRMMRAVRIAAALRFSLNSDTAASVQRDSNQLTNSAPERIREELLKTLAESGARDSIRLMDRLGLLSQVIPEIDQARDVAQPKEHHWDVFNHLVETVGFAESILDDREGDDLVSSMLPRFDGMREYFASEATDGASRSTLLRFTGLIHDIGKPASKTLEPSGRIRFFGHNEVGAEMAGTIMGRLRFGRRGIRMVKTMIQHHLRPMQMAATGKLPTKRAVYRYFRDVGDPALDTLYLNVADFLAARGPELTEEGMAEVSSVISHILKTEYRPEPAVPVGKGLIDGNDVMNEFGLESGPEVGRVLSAVASAEAIGTLNTKEEALTMARELLESGGVSA
ncbi:MAG: hypothetical protein CL694_10090 [Chloroflexi bacterium]|jgi:poly(A) polymerase|nr:hypothetical protein [Chloroflexota bacterium]MDP6800746.1 HD domain-containing protein [SAR202 cluster bacterium]HAL48653.1 hypothetical protein [Dehalococcoidia bacterium]